MSERQKLMKRIAMLDFALVELHLYMDSHPNDKEIAKKFDSYKTKSKDLRKEYEEKYGPIQARSTDANSWAWISNPWPWDIQEGVI